MTFIINFDFNLSQVADNYNNKSAPILYLLMLQRRKGTAVLCGLTLTPTLTLLWLLEPLKPSPDGGDPANRSGVSVGGGKKKTAVNVEV